VALIGLFFIAVLGIIGAAVSRQLTDEFKAWTPWLISYIIRRAVRQLPEDMRTRYEEEWRSHTDEIPGEVGKLIHALNCLSAKRTLDVVGSMEQRIEEQLLARQSEILNLRERIRHYDNSIAEEAANLKTLAGQKATFARLVA
jgi:hypothetical protein